MGRGLAWKRIKPEGDRGNGKGEGGRVMCWHSMPDRTRMCTVMPLNSHGHCWPLGAWALIGTVVASSISMQ